MLESKVTPFVLHVQKTIFFGIGLHMCRVLCGICQQQLAQAFFRQKCFQLLIGIAFHSVTISRPRDTNIARQIMNHAERPDLAVKGLFRPHGAAGFAEHGTEEQFLAPQRRCRKCLLLSRRNQLRRSTHTVHGFHRFLRQYRKFPRVCTVKPAAEPAGCTGFGRKNLSQHA